METKEVYHGHHQGFPFLPDLDELTAGLAGMGSISSGAPITL